MTNTRTLAFAAVFIITSLCAGLDLAAQRSTNNARGARKPKSAFVHRHEEGQPGHGRKARQRPRPVVDVYKDFDAWFGENRDHATLTAMGYVLGVDYFIHPVAELADGISPNTDVVLLTSNGAGQASTRLSQNEPNAQSNLQAFARAGGVVIVDMGDNDYDGGFLAPGSVGTPYPTFPEPGDDATLSSAAKGPDGLLGTADDHRIVRGPDGIPNSLDDLDDGNIDMCCYVAHGNLADGMALPPRATVLMTATYDSVQRPVLAEYCLGSGRVIVDTITKEFIGHDPSGTGPSRFLAALLSYALDPLEHAPCAISELRDDVGSMTASRSIAKALQAHLIGSARDLARGGRISACGKLRAFINAARAHRNKKLAAALVDDWVARAERLRTALGC